MGFKEVQDLSADITIGIGGTNSKTGKPNPTKLEGYYLGNRTVKSEMSKTGTAKIYFFQTTKGNVAVWGKTDLDRKMGVVTLGALTRVSFSGMQKVPGKKDMYKYKVEVDNENTIEVETPQENPTTATSFNEEADSDEAYAAATTPNFGDTEGEDEEQDLDAEDEVSTDAAPQIRARPAVTAAATDAARQARVQALLNKGKAKVA